jgi:lambda family phage portal protein
VVEEQYTLEDEIYLQETGALAVESIPWSQLDAVELSASSALESTGYVSPTYSAVWDGEKYPGGFGPTNVFDVDYQTLRERSSQLFTENLYARGVIRRLVTNVINTGLSLESCPDEELLGMEQDSLIDWQERVENLFHLWGKNAAVCDYYSQDTYGEIQKSIYREALIEGDVLVMLHIDEDTGFPKVRTISGGRVMNPLEDTATENEIKHGVEIDRRGRHLAYWVRQEDDTVKRVPAWGPNSGRRVAWLVYGTDRRKDDVRGQPFLSLLVQCVKELDRYRDATVRKAVLNAVVAMFIKKEQEKIGTKPMTGGATRRGAGIVTDRSGIPRRFNIQEHVPGMVFEELQVGESPQPHSIQGTDVNFGDFESAIIQTIAWANEVPPEILQLSFSHNYSASQAATNEFKIFLNMERTRSGDVQCQLVYEQWLVSAVAVGMVQAEGLLEAWHNPKMWATWGAWVLSDWSGAIKPSVDILKQSKGYKHMVDECWTTNERTSRELTGTKFRKNVTRVRRENELKAEAMRPLLEILSEFGKGPADGGGGHTDGVVQEAIKEAVFEALEDLEIGK